MNPILDEQSKGEGYFMFGRSRQAPFSPRHHARGHKVRTNWNLAKRAKLKAKRRNAA